jgi:N-acetylglucosaminyl-diphospho-decaprenol L-rhamnosyltransferase
VNPHGIIIWMVLSYCVVNTNGRERLLACLDAIERTAPEGVEREVLVLDNASTDGSAEAVRELGRQIELIERDRRTGKAENDSTLLRTARGDYCLLLNEDTELQPEAPRRLLDALDADPGAAVAGCALLDTNGRPEASAWRLPSVGTALAAALFLHRVFIVQGGGSGPQPVGWAQSSAMLVRRSAADGVGYLDRDFFVYSDETDFCKRLHDAGWRVLHVPEAVAVHHDQLETDTAGARRRIVEFHRNRDLYMRKHHSAAAAAVARLAGAWFYLMRAAAAAVLPGHGARHWLLHARQALTPGRGDGIREAAEAFNRTRPRASALPR